MLKSHTRWRLHLRHPLLAKISIYLGHPLHGTGGVRDGVPARHCPCGARGVQLIPGRNGYLALLEGAHVYKDTTLTVGCFARDLEDGRHFPRRIAPQLEVFAMKNRYGWMTKYFDYGLQSGQPSRLLPASCLWYTSAIGQRDRSGVAQESEGVA